MSGSRKPRSLHCIPFFFYLPFSVIFRSLTSYMMVFTWIQFVFLYSTTERADKRNIINLWKWCHTWFVKNEEKFFSIREFVHSVSFVIHQMSQDPFFIHHGGEVTKNFHVFTFKFYHCQCPESLQSPTNLPFSSFFPLNLKR